VDSRFTRIGDHTSKDMKVLLGGVWTYGPIPASEMEGMVAHQSTVPAVGNSFSIRLVRDMEALWKKD